MSYSPTSSELGSDAPLATCIERDQVSKVEKVLGKRKSVETEATGSVKMPSRTSSRLKNTKPLTKSAIKKKRLSGKETEGIEEISSSSSEKVTPASERPTPSKENKVDSQTTPTFKYEDLKNKSRSLKFWNRESSERYSLFTEKDIWCERSIMFDKHKEVKVMIYDLLGNVEFEKLLDYPTGYYEGIVREFYANLCESVFLPSSNMFGLVYFRGGTIEFSAEKINRFLGLPSVATEGLAEPTMDVLAQELTGSSKAWNKNMIQCSSLLLKYSVLHKIAKVNWTPTKQSTLVNKDIALFLYRIGTGTRFDFGAHVFNSIKEYASVKSKTVLLPFPCIICGVILAQAPSLIEPGEFKVSAPPPITLQAKTLIKVTKETPEAAVPKPKEASQARNEEIHIEVPVERATSYLARRLLGIRQAREALDKEEKEIRALLATSATYKKMSSGAEASKGKNVRVTKGAVESSDSGSIDLSQETEKKSSGSVQISSDSGVGPTDF